jgi:hypothetical protein
MTTKQNLKRLLTVTSLSLAALAAQGCGNLSESSAAYSELSSGSNSKCNQDPSIQWHYAPANQLNRSVQRAAKAYVGDYIPNERRHECTDLVTQALRDVGARTRYSNRAGTVFPRLGSGDYEWGRFVGSMTRAGRVPSNVTPGDIVQFRDSRFKYTFRDGNRTRWVTMNAAHHSAVVSSVSRDRRHICVLQQNPDRVHYGWFPVSAMEQGKLWFYRPVAN